MRLTIHSVVLSVLITSLLEKTSRGSAQCPSINNAVAGVNTQFPGMQTYNITVKGCLQPEQFLGGRIESIDIACIGAEITQLEEHSIGNMSQLKYIRIQNCPIEFVEPKAFENIANVSRIVLMKSKIKELLKGVFDGFPSLQSLDVQKNEIDFIEDATFAGLTDMVYLTLSYNRLAFWNRRWFQDNLNLYLIDLAHNSLRRIPARAFMNLPKLKNLDLSYNKISLIDASAFVDVVNMTILNLNHNHLTTLPMNMFGRIIGRKLMLKLELNFLNYLPELLVQRMMYSLGSLFIRGNPFKCPCLDLIHKTIHEYNLQLTLYERIFLASYAECARPDIPQCVFAKDSPYNCTETVDNGLTSSFVNYLQTLNPPVADICYNADDIA